MKLIVVFFAALALIFSLNCAAQETNSSDSMAKPEPAFEKVEKEADYTGGIPAWRQFLQKNLNPDVPVKNGAPSGKFTVWIQFIIDKEGNVSDIKTLTEHGYGMEEEVTRIIRKSGKWTPAILHGKPVKAYRKQPVTFLVEDEQYEITTPTPYVLYTNTDNEISINVYKIKKEDIRLTISEGTITPGADGNYIIRVKKTGRVLIDIYNTKKNKKIGTASFEVMAQGKDKS